MQPSCIGWIVAAIGACAVNVLAVHLAFGQSGSIRVVGHLGGQTQAVHAEANYVYLGEGPQLTILDVSNPAAPRKAGAIFLPETPADVVVRSGRAYVANGGHGLLVVNVSNPSSPTLLGSYNTPGSAGGVCLVSDLAYVADGTTGGLQIINVSNPSAPTLAGSYNTPGSAEDVFTSGSMAYVADGNGLRIIDVSNPSSPTLRSFCYISGHISKVCVSGRTAYVSDWVNGFHIVDATNPSSPTLRSSYDCYAEGFFVSDNLAYLSGSILLSCCCPGGGGMEVVDVSNPTSPTHRSFGYSRGGGGGLYVAANRAYVGSSLGGLDVLDVSSPSVPVWLGAHDVPGAVGDICVSNSLAYITSCYESLQIFDVSDPSLPSGALAMYHLPDECSILGVYAITNGLAYVRSYIYGEAGFEILDVTNPTSPTRIGAFATTFALMTRNAVRIDDNRAYVCYKSGSATSGGLLIVDLIVPTSPTLLGSCATPIAPESISVSGDFVYAAAKSAGLIVIDASNPYSPQVRLSWATPGPAFSVAVREGLAYVACNATPPQRGSHLLVVNVTDPLSPRLVGRYDTTAQWFGDIALSERLLYVADSNNYLEVLDVSDPAHPRLAASGPSSAGVELGDVHLFGGLAYMAGGYSGLWILEYVGSPPTRVAGWTRYQ